MATTITNGTVTSFVNTPQAGDDLYLAGVTGLTEDSTAVVWLNVMANDLGGAAKVLYSLDDGISAGTAPADLLVKDLGRTEALSTDTSLGGAKIWITSDGKVGYDSGTLSPAFRAQLQALNPGEYLTDSFTYAIRMSSGALSWATATIQFSGVNDAPTVTGVVVGTAVEDGGLVTLNALANASDLDTGSTLTVVGVPDPDDLPAGVTYDPTTAMFTLDPSNAAYQHLATGQTTPVTVNYGVSDGTVTTAASVSFTVTGINDDPVVTGAVTGNATEDGVPVTLDALANASDVDDGTTLGVVNLPAPLPAGVTFDALTHSFTLDPANAAFQHLGYNETTDVIVNYDVSDGIVTTSASVKFTITGTNDQPTLTITDAAGALTEGDGAAALADSGALSFTDLDATDLVTVSQTSNGDITWSGGELAPALASALVAGFSVDQDSWDYATSANLDFLAAGETITFSYAVVATDDSDQPNAASASQNVTITITGTNDQPTLTITDAAGALTEGDSAAALADSGALSFADLDTTDVVTVSQISNGDIAWSDGTLAPALAATLVAGFSVDQDSWGYSTNANLDFLAAGETITFSYTVVATDDSGQPNAASASQNVTITITGTNDQPTLTITDAAGALTEGDGAAALADSGALSFADLDVNDAVAVSATSNGDITWSGGSLAPALASALVAGFSVDQDSWDYATNANLDFLAAGETITFSYAVVATDDSGQPNAASASQNVTITITGTNDQPTLTITDAAGALTEGDGAAALADSGALSFTDLDTTDVVTVSQTSNGDIAWSGGSLVPALASALVAGFSVDQNSWDYSTNANLDFLAAGETITFSYAVVATDDSGQPNAASASQNVTITITGTNDQPTLTITDAAGALTEGDGAAALADSGALSFTDLDTTDVVTVSQTSNGDIAWSGGSLVPALASALVAGFSVDQNSWDYSTNANLDFLAAGETITFSYAVVATDDSGQPNAASASQNVTITITGTNDAPVLSSAATPVLASVNEDAGAPTGAVGTLVSSLVNPNPPAGGLDNVTDADDAASTGIALTGASDTNGTWWYSTDGGSNWSTVDAVSDSSALLLTADANTRIYFQPNADFNGLVTNAITFRAWDQTSGSAGSMVDVSTNGGTTPFSTATDTANISVAAVNDSAVAASDVLYVSNSTAVTLPTSVLLANDVDIDGIALSVTAMSVVTGTLATPITINPNGTFSFTTDATGGTVASPTVVTLSYTLSDGAGGTATGTITLNVIATDLNNVDTVDLSGVVGYQGSYINTKGGADNATDGGATSVLVGGTQGDTLNGNDGNDVLQGGSQNDILNGGDGNDILQGGTNNDTMDGGAGIDLLDFSDASGVFSFSLGAGGAGPTTVNGNDSYSNMEGVIGNSSANTLTGNTADNIIRGGGGNDTLSGAGGTDLIDFSDGTAGITFALVNNGVGTVFNASAAGLGTDTYSGFEGVIGTAFADTLTGSSSADVLRGGGGNDVISGGDGNDVLAGGEGADTLNGGIGNDTFLFDTAPNAVDTIQDFSANSADMIELSSSMFSGIGTSGTLNAADFSAGDASTVVGAGVNVIYDGSTGNLYYDSNGGDSVNRTLLATVTINDLGTFDNTDIKVGP